MTNTHAGRCYRQSSARGASPVGLVVALYDAALDSLRRAMKAHKENNIEKRTAELNHTLAVVGELQGSLDFERGGDVARYLALFYDFARTKLLEVNVTGSEEILPDLTNQFFSLREAWQRAEESNTATVLREDLNVSLNEEAASSRWSA